MAKPRPPQGKIAFFTDEQRERLNQWLRENLSYAEIKARLLSEFNVSMAASSLCNYRKRHLLEIFPFKAIDVEDASVDMRTVSLALGAEIRVRLENGWFVMALRDVRLPLVPALLKQEGLNA
jgi:hypothetical protein